MNEQFFCQTWKNRGLAFLKNTEEIKVNFEFLEACLVPNLLLKLKNVTFNQKIKRNNVMVYEYETFERDKAQPFAFAVSVDLVFLFTGNCDQGLTRGG